MLCLPTDHVLSPLQCYAQLTVFMTSQSYVQLTFICNLCEVDLQQLVLEEFGLSLIVQIHKTATEPLIACLQHDGTD